MAMGGGIPSTTGLPTVKAFSSFAPTQAPPSTPFVQSDDSSSYSRINAGRVAAAAVMLAASSGLFLPPTPPAAFAEGWQTPLSIARPVVRATPQNYDLPLSPLVTPASTAIPIPIDMGGSQPQTRSVYYQARSEPPYVAPPVVAAPATVGWLAPLSTGLATNRVADTNGPFPWFTPNPVTLDEWQQPLSVAPETTKPKADFGSYSAPVTVTPKGWQGSLETAPRPARARVEFGFVPYYQVTVSVTGWQAPLATAVAVRRQPQTDYALPIYIAPLVANTVTIDKWQQPLAGAPKVATAQPGFSFVPFNTVQPVVVPATAIGIPIDMGGQLPQLRSVYYQARSEPPYVTPVVVPATPQGWQQPLAGAPKTATAQAGFSFVPYNAAAQVSVTVTLAWQQQLSGAPRKPKAQEGFVLVPFTRLAVTGTLNATEAPDTALFNGDAVISAVLGATDPQDAAAFSGTVFTAITGTLATTEAKDTAAFAGYPAAVGTLAATEVKDTAAFAVFTGSTITGVLAATDPPDLAKFIVPMTSEPGVLTFGRRAVRPNPW